MADWIKIRDEYVTTDACLRELADKHKIAASAVFKHSSDEGWVELREQHRRLRSAKVSDKAASAAASYFDKKSTIADKMLKNIEDFVDEMGLDAVPVYDKLALTIQRMDSIRGWRSEADMEEQRVRIDNLRRQVNAASGADADGRHYGVLILPEIKPLTPPGEAQEDDCDDCDGC